MEFITKVIHRIIKTSAVDHLMRCYARGKAKAWKTLPHSYITDAQNVISNIHPKPEGHAYWDNPTKAECLYDLSVIVPFYNTKQYAIQCIESILQQETKYSFEVILIDDGSPDGVGEILDRYKDRKNVKVIHKANGGLSDARNCGIRIAQGEYLTFVDSDDFLAKNAVEVLMQNAREYSADIVDGSYVTFRDRTTYRPCRIARHKFSVSNEGKGMYGFACGKVYRKKLFNQTCFPVGYWFEDTIIGGLIFPNAHITVTIPEIVYCYYINTLGITHQAAKNPKSIDTYYIFEELLDTKNILNLPITSSTKNGVVWQLSQYVYSRCHSLGEENMKYLFVLCAKLAERYGVLESEFMEKQSFWAKEVCEAFAHLQYDRWKLAAKMI